MLVLKSIKGNMTSYGGFVWPESGRAEAPDWKPTKACGNGLHGFLWGEGDGSLACWDADAKWLVLRPEGEVVDLGGKVKFRACEVMFCGDRQSATAHICANGGAGKRIVGHTATAGDRGTATAGDGGTAKGGKNAILKFKWWDGNRWRYTLAYVGENGIKENTSYRLNDKHEPEEVI